MFDAGPVKVTRIWVGSNAVALRKVAQSRFSPNYWVGKFPSTFTGPEITNKSYNVLHKYNPTIILAENYAINHIS